MIGTFSYQYSHIYSAVIKGKQLFLHHRNKWAHTNYHTNCPFFKINFINNKIYLSSSSDCCGPLLAISCDKISNSGERDSNCELFSTIYSNSPNNELLSDISMVAKLLSSAKKKEKISDKTCSRSKYISSDIIIEGYIAHIYFSL